MRPDENMITRYFRGECSAEEVAVVEAYLQQPQQHELDAYLAEVWKEETAAPAILQPVRNNGIRYWLTAAAAIALLVMAGTWLWKSDARRQQLAAALEVRDTVRNEGNDIRVLTLSDGSKVWLDAYSSLVYTNRYNNASRELWLNGAAYFEVAQDTRRPFKVHTGDLTTIAIGTAFHIATANRADGGIEVSLAEGKVSVSTQQERYLLEPGQMVTYQQHKLNTPTPFEGTFVNDWKNGQLQFEGAKLGDVFYRLQARYGCRIIIANNNTKLAARKVSGSFSKDEQLTDILNALKYVYNFSYEAGDSNTYIISGNRP